MSTSHALLGLLAVGGTRHGYELKREHERRLAGVRPLAFGQMYTTLARLLRDGRIVEAAHERAGGPDRVAYQLTPAGRCELDGWLDQLEEPSPYITAQLFLRVAVALLVSPDEETARRCLAAQRERHLAEMRSLTRIKTDRAASVTQVVAADFLLNHLDADLRWIATTLQRVGQLRAEVHA
jgi:DNA-binding PadR family transcriptional regulator